MIIKEKQNINCTCGKLVAIRRNGKIYVYCKGCKRQVQITEPRAIEPKSR